MAEIEQKAQAKVNEVAKERGIRGFCIFNRQTGAVEEALCRAIEQREATKQEFSDFQHAVSDALQSWVDGGIDRPAYIWFRKNLAQFIIPAVEPDPLVDALLYLDLCSDPEEGRHDAKWIRHKLNAAGFEIREKSK